MKHLRIRIVTQPAGRPPGVTFRGVRYVDPDLKGHVGRIVRVEVKRGGDTGWRLACLRGLTGALVSVAIESELNRKLLTMIWMDLRPGTCRSAGRRFLRPVPPHRPPAHHR